jgi:truncated hemoglobin YjbI
MAQTIFQRLGGTPAISLLISNFYKKVLADPISAPVFAHTDMDEQRRLQVEFFSNALGSGTPYTGRKMVAAHTGLGITEEQFSAVAKCLSDSLLELNVPQDIYESAVSLFDSYKSDIINR